VPFGIVFFPPDRIQLKTAIFGSDSFGGAHASALPAVSAASPASRSPTTAITSVPRAIFHCRATGSLPGGETTVIRREPDPFRGAIEGTTWKVCANRGEQTTRIAKIRTIVYYRRIGPRSHQFTVMQHLFRSARHTPYLRVLLASAVLAACPHSFSATLSIANQTANQGQTAVAPVQFAAGGDAIAALQFDLQWDPGLAVQVGPGLSASQGYKVLYPASPAPGVLRCLIIGANQNAFTDGEILELFITAGVGAFPGAAQVNLTNVVASDATGEPVTIQPASVTVQIQNGGTLIFPAQSVLNGASLLAGAVAPGEIVTLLDLFPAAPTVSFNGVQAPIIYPGTGQVNVVVPFEMDLSGPVDVQIGSPNGMVAEQSIPVALTAPAIFTQTGTGAGPAAATNPDTSANSFSNPAAAGAILIVYGTGFGSTQSALLDGQIATGPSPLVLPVTATVGGVNATVVYAGAAPAQIAGLTQISIQVPGGLPSDPNTPIALTVGGVTTPTGVTVSIISQ
jgi:uncharacterized protein (TIGR03437 family)